MNQNFKSNLWKKIAKYLLLVLGIFIFPPAIPQDYVSELNETNGMSYSLDKVLERLEGIHKVSFFYEPVIIQKKIVQLDMNSLEKETLSKSLEKIFTNLDLECTKINDEVYVIFDEGDKVKKSKYLDKLPVQEKNPVARNTGEEMKLQKLTSQNKATVKQEGSVSGVVTDIDGVPLPGVNIVIKSTQQGTVTDINGKYTIDASEGNTLVFSYIGMLSEEAKVQSSNVIDIQLVPDLMGLEEVIVVGYGSIKKSDLTGVVSTVKSEEIRKLAVPTIEQAIQGQAAGVYATRMSGEPGKGAKIYIRGAGSINNTDPLWVVDGIPTEAGNTLDMSEVESIEILKDASAAAIYGARAANGVILVTTKRGEKGKPKVNFNAYYGINTPLNLPELADAYEYSKLNVEAYLNAGRTPKEIYTKVAMGDTVPTHNTDWMDVMFRNGSIENYNFNVSGGGDFVSYYASADYLREEGTHIGSHFERISVVLNTDYKLSDRITIGESLNLIQTEFDPKEIADEKFLRVNPFMPVWADSVSHPWEPYGTLPKDEYGMDEPNHYGIENVNVKSDKWYKVRGSLFANVEILPSLTWRTTVGGLISLRNNYYYQKRYDLTPYVNNRDKLEREFEDNRDYIANSVLTYDKDFGEHSLSLMAGYEAQKIFGTKAKAIGEDFPEGVVIFDQSNALLRNVSGEEREPERWYSQFGRVNYGYANKYLITFNLRRDGSSKFGSNYRYGVFPSFSAAWRITEEPFMVGLSQLMNLKLRGGYGVLGNANIKNFVFLSNVRSDRLYYTWGGPGDNAYLQSGAHPNTFANEDIRWEKLFTSNVGFDMGLFQNRVLITSDFYVKNTKDMLIEVALPLTAGLGREGTTFINLGEVKNSGVELEILYKDRRGDLSYSLGLNGAYNKNEVLKLNEDDIIIAGKYGIARTEVGYPIGYFSGYEIEGTWGTTRADTLAIMQMLGITDPIRYSPASKTGPGDFIYKDRGRYDESGRFVAEPDSAITEADKTMIGNPWPKFVFGGTLSAEYRNFDFTLFVQGVMGMEIANFLKIHSENIWGDWGTTPRAFDRWTPDNQTDNRPRLTYNDPNRNLSNPSTYFIENGSYLRLKNLQLGYTLPLSLTERMKISNLRLYASIQNLLTFTKYTGIDPEVFGGEAEGEKKNTYKNIDEGSYPQSRTYQFGIQVGF